ncbi:unnamed protein product [Lactuca saligna]|uniref:CSC1/OSCA1-like 7TM region domain-containing protein n=1 Tax=Lactuca saligna TaxID=75948 RepID=A0AA35VFR4_LACSI|nr:unnamed protein product [Lactuca saligna]
MIFAHLWNQVSSPFALLLSRQQVIPQTTTIVPTSDMNQSHLFEHKFNLKINEHDEPRNHHIPFTIFMKLSIRRVLMVGAFIGLTFFFMIPIAFVQTLANIESIEKVVPFLKPIINMVNNGDTTVITKHHKITSYGYGFREQKSDNTSVTIASLDENDESMKDVETVEARPKKLSTSHLL